MYTKTRKPTNTTTKPEMSNQLADAIMINDIPAAIIIAGINNNFLFCIVKERRECIEALSPIC